MTNVFIQLTHSNSRQNSKKSKHPCLLRVETKSGHSGATPTTKIKEYSDIMAFVYKLLKIEEQIQKLISSLKPLEH
jgi:hypothetical protein